MRKKRSERRLEEAQAGMEQVASERQAAEEEYAAKKTAAAQAEAEAMKRHADKLAATEKDALEQRKNSWVNRLKSIVGATVSAATGAFTGGIGTRAGQEAANAIFRPE
jgi:FtsZ-binding cell division protein ZapB